MAKNSMSGGYDGQSVAGNTSESGYRNESTVYSSADEPARSGGIGDKPRSDWPKVPARAATIKPIDRLTPGSETHWRIVQYLVGRLEMSERKMTQFYSRWRVNERKFQAYVDLPDYEKILKDQNDKGKPAQVIHITLPYSYATIATIVTYLVHTFTGRRPIFQVSSNNTDSMAAASNMEIVLQYNADHCRLVKQLFQFLQDSEIYGVGILRTQFKTDFALRTVWKQNMQYGFLDAMMPQGMQKSREFRKVYQGNEVAAIDPFMFFPDPRVPMADVNKKGEFVFWRSFTGMHELLKEQEAGRFKWINYIPKVMRANSFNAPEGLISSRSLVSRGDPIPGYNTDARLGQRVSPYIQIDQGTCDIVPAELGLSPSTRVERWLFAIGNKSQIIQAEPFEADHGMHPVAVTEPHTMGYGFGQMGSLDYLNPLQDTMSWFLNSHMENVRTAINNMFIVDPSKIEVQDLKKPGPGKIIRLKRAAYGQDVKTAITQLQVMDITKGHVNDLALIMKMGDALSSVTDNLRGLQDQGGRKTATEVRTAGEAAASRLAAECRLISAQAIVDLTEQMCLNNQQNLEDDFFMKIVGQEGSQTPIHITPEMLVGDFYYPINDGTLPIDRVATIDIWKQIFMAITQDPQMSQEYDRGKIFEYIAELSGARTIKDFKVQPGQMPTVMPNLQPDAQVQAQAQAGNVVPMPRSGRSTPSPISSIPMPAMGPGGPGVG